MAIDKNLLLSSLPFVQLSEDEVETLPVMRILLTYITIMMHVVYVYDITWQYSTNKQKTTFFMMFWLMEINASVKCAIEFVLLQLLDFSDSFENPVNHLKVGIWDFDFLFFLYFSITRFLIER